MTAMELNAELFRELSIIAEDESMMKRVVNYLKKLTAKKKDDTLMTKEEFFAKIERAEQQIDRGEGMMMLPEEDLTTFLT